MPKTGREINAPSTARLYYRVQEKEGVDSAARYHTVLRLLHELQPRHPAPAAVDPADRAAGYRDHRFPDMGARFVFSGGLTHPMFILLAWAFIFHAREDRRQRF